MFSDIYFRLLLDVMERDPRITSIPKTSDLTKAGKPVTPVRFFFLLIEHIYQQAPDSDLGMAYGKHLVPMNACDFSSLLTTAKTLRNSIDLLLNHYHMLNLRPYPIVYQKDGVVSLALTYPYEEKYPKGAKRFSAETFFSYCMNSVGIMIEKTARPMRLYLDFPKPDYYEQYIERFKCPIEFDAPLTMMEFSDQVMDGEMPTSNPALHKIHLEKIQENWSQLKRHQSYRYRSVTHLMRTGPESFSSDAIAKALNISTRGLQKRLSAEGCSFSDISRQVRRELTKVCLFQQGMDFDETAQRLGFQTQATFRRFFKEQFGINPKQFMAKHFSYD